MNNQHVVLIAFKQFDNLGMGYLASVLSGEGYKTSILDFRDGKEKILIEIKNLNPILVGFSVIFLYHIYEFKELIDYLRKSGIKCHFTAGGHYASLRFEELFNIIPSLDSVVRFEGEYTFLELTKCIHEGADWRKVRSIAFRNNGQTIINTLRPLEKNLDRFPIPLRAPLKEYALGKKFATLLAGRGCIHDCAFCDIREFYRQPPGPNKRIRQPKEVIREMEFLYNENECSVFLFQDDDFPVKTVNGSQWVKTFCKELKLRKLNGKIMWKINCRPDEVDLNSFSMMKDHGLYLVFLGIEDGTDSGLRRINKQMTVAKSLEGINILKKLNIGFDYGFMLFQPYSTFDSINDNLDFLREICGDGFTPITYLKMLPFFETRIEKELRYSGRIKGEPGFWDYDFLDCSMDHYYNFTTECFMDWLRDQNGLLSVSRWARNYLSVFFHYYNMSLGVNSLSEVITKTISQSNKFFLDNMKELGPVFKAGKYNKENYSDLEYYRTNVKIQHDNYKEQISDCVEKLLNIAALQELSKSVFA